MIYASIYQDKMLFGLADTREEWRQIKNREGVYIPSTIEWRTDDVLELFFHLFISKTILKDDDIIILPIKELASKQKKLDIEDRLFFANPDSIGEQYGLNNFDPWDGLTDEERASKKELAEKIKELNKENIDSSAIITDISIDEKGKVTAAKVTLLDNDKLEIKHTYKKTELNKIADFNGNPAIYSCNYIQRDIQFIVVSSIDPSQYINNFCQKDGWFVVTNEIDAHRIFSAALFEKKECEIFPVNGEGETIYEYEFDSTSLKKITADGIIGIYYKLTSDFPLQHVKQFLPKPIECCQEENASWLVYVSERETLNNLDILEQKGIFAKLSIVNENGDLIIEDNDIGAYVVGDTEIIARPWNNHKDLFDGDWSKIPNKEFLFCVISLKFNLTCVFITPREYFFEHEDFWGGEIKKPFLDDFRKTEHPYMFQISRQLSDVAYMLNSKGLDEDMMFKIHVNQMF